MKLYSTVRGAASAEQIIEKSRFIAYVAPVSDREEAEAFITSIRKKHKDATHNVPAMKQQAAARCLQLRSSPIRTWCRRRFPACRNAPTK